MADKKYYWLKLKDNFFEEKYIKALRKLPGGNELIIVYLKMQLKSLKTEGIINYEKIMPNHVEELALVLDEDTNTVRATLLALERMQLIELWDDDTIYMKALQELIGSETSVASRVRKHREQQKVLQCNTNETQCNEIELHRNTEKEKDIEKDIEKEKEKEKIKNKTVKTVFEAYASGELLIILFEFKKMRDKQKASLTPYAAEKLLSKLDSLASDEYTKIKILEQSIMNSWKGIFELKEPTAYNKPRQTPQQVMAQDMSYLEEGDVFDSITMG